MEPGARQRWEETRMSKKDRDDFARAELLGWVAQRLADHPREAFAEFVLTPLEFMQAEYGPHRVKVTLQVIPETGALSARCETVAGVTYEDAT